MTSRFPVLLLNLRSLLDQLLGDIDLTLAEVRHTAIRIVVIWLLTWAGWRLVKWIARQIVTVAARHEMGSRTMSEQRAKTIAGLLLNVGRGTLLVLAAILTLNEFINIGPLLGVSAVLGLAVSFGAQSLVKDYFAGFFILMENQFVVGDSIDAAGKSGTVERLTLRTVTLRDLDGTVHIVPNGQITTLSNKTRGWSRAVIDVGIGYDNDIDAVIDVLREEAKAFHADPTWSDRFDASPEVLGVESFGDHGVTLRILLRTRPGMQGEAAREFRRRIMIRLEHEGIKGARPTHLITVQEGHGSSNRTIAATPSATVQSNPAPKPPDPNASPLPGVE